MSTDTAPRHAVSGDHVLTHEDSDRLGFASIAAELAIAINESDASEGLVVGIVGRWGSGKSSLLFLMERALQSLKSESGLQVVGFRPWLIGHRDALAGELFTAIRHVVASVRSTEGDDSDPALVAADEATARLKAFSAALHFPGRLIEIPGWIAFPQAGALSAVLKAIGAWGSRKAIERELTEHKSLTERALRALGRKIVVTIDDVDRLEPRELLEVIRLVRSVANLPNVVYVLCYDAEVLAHGLEQAAGVEDGRAYLEKIVQLSVMVPAPEEFALREWFTQELRSIGEPKDRESAERLKQVIDIEGRSSLKTPRSVTRVLDQVRFYWPVLRTHEADLADLVWLQLIKHSRPGLYRWIEEYCSAEAAIATNLARVGAGERERSLQHLRQELGVDDVATSGTFELLMEHLPGVARKYVAETATAHIFERMSEEEIAKAIHDHRLKSPDHYRMYFSMSEPSATMTRNDWHEFWGALESGGDIAITAFQRLSREKVIASLTKADVLLERVAQGGTEITSVRAEALLFALSNAIPSTPKGEAGFSITLGDRASRALPLLLKALPTDLRLNTLLKMFGSGSSLPWLTRTYRREVFAHGLYGDRRKPTEEWWLTQEQLDQVTSAMLKRFRALAFTQIAELADPLDVLFAWSQAGDPDGPRNLISGNCESDAGLLDTLEAMTTFVFSSNKGRYPVLKEAHLAPFLDVHDAKRRIDGLTTSPDESIRERAYAIKLAFADGEERG